MTHFTLASELTNTDSLIVAAWGGAKVGKTTFLTGNAKAGIGHWPLPIYLLNFDQGLKELLPNMDPAAISGLYNVDLVAESPVLTPAQSAALLERTNNAIQEAAVRLMMEGRGTLAMDTATAYWRLVTDVSLASIRGSRKDGMVYPFDYRDANAQFRNLITQLKTTGANLLLLHHARELHDDHGKRTGILQAQDQADIEKLVQIELQLWVKSVGMERIHGGTIQLCRQNDALTNASYPDLDYSTLYRLVFGKDPSA